MTDRTPLPPPDPERFMAEIAHAWPGPEYTPDDRWRDFRQVFLGSEQGKRVLYQLLTWAHLWSSSFVKGDPTETAFKEGERNVGLRVIAALHVEPKPRPNRQVRNKPRRSHVRDDSSA